MKKTMSLLILFSVIAMSCFLTACKKGNDNIPTIYFKNDFDEIQKYYYVGDEIELNGQCINYFNDIRDENPSEKDIVVTKDMISNFSTQTAGEFSYKITYNQASKQVTYYVYEKPTLTTSYGLYISACFGRNATVEIKENQVIVNTYQEGVTDYKGSEPISSTTIDTKIKANKNGLPSISFVYEQQKYEFCSFNEQGIPTKVKHTILSDGKYSTMQTNCTKIG